MALDHFIIVGKSRRLDCNLYCMYFFSFLCMYKKWDINMQVGTVQEETLGKENMPEME